MNVPSIQQIGPISPVPTITGGTMDIVRAALATGNIDMLREATALAKELDAIAARKAFDNAMADAVFPVIKKNRLVDFATDKGRTTYKHEDLAEVVATVAPVLRANGLSHRFRVTSNPNEPVTVTCIISHRAGHFEETTLAAGRDESGKKNSIQAVASTLTYLQRMTLKAALGLAASDDDDGRTSEQAEPETYTPPAGSITQQQVDFIRDALEEKGASASAFLQWANGKGMFAGRKQRLEELPAQHYAAAVNAIANFKKA